MTAQHTEHPEPYDYRELLANLRGEIARRDMPMQRVAEMSGISQPSFSRRMNGGDFTVRELLTVCNVLGVTLDDLTRPVPPAQKGGSPQVTHEKVAVRRVGNVLYPVFGGRKVQEHEHLAPVIHLADRRKMAVAA